MWDKTKLRMPAIINEHKKNNAIMSFSRKNDQEVLIVSIFKIIRFQV